MIYANLIVVADPGKLTPKGFGYLIGVKENTTADHNLLCVTHRHFEHFEHCIDGLSELEAVFKLISQQQVGQRFLVTAQQEGIDSGNQRYTPTVAKKIYKKYFKNTGVKMS